MQIGVIKGCNQQININNKPNHNITNPSFGQFNVKFETIFDRSNPLYQKG